MKRITLVALALVSTSAFAQSAVNTTIASKKTSAFETFKKNSSMFLYTSYTGGSAKNLTSNQTIDPYGKRYKTTDPATGKLVDANAPTNTWNILGYIYNTGRGFNLYAQHVFEQYSGANDQRFHSLNPRVGINNINIPTGKVQSQLNIQFELGTTEFAVAQDDIVNPALVFTNSYQVNSKHSLSMFTQARTFIYENTTAGKAANAANRDYHVYMLPQHSYAINDKFQILTTYQIRLDQGLGKAPGTAAGNFMRRNNEVDELLVGFNWNITPNISMYPFAALPRVSNYSIDKADWGIWFNANLF